MKKYPYLLYPLVLLFPPVHEMIHIFICWRFGAEVTRISFAKMWYIDNGSIWLETFHNIHDSIIEPMWVTFFLVLFICYYLKDHNYKLRFKTIKTNKNYITPKTL